MRATFLITWLFVCCLSLVSPAQNVGIGTPAPAAKLHVQRAPSSGSVLSTATVVSENNSTNWLQFLNPDANDAGILSSTNLTSIRSGIVFDPDSAIRFRAGGNTTRLYVGANGNVGIGTLTPSPSAALQINSTSKGLLIPRLTEAQRNNILSPSNGLLVYQTDGIPGFYYLAETKWLNLAGYELQQNITTNGKYISSDGSASGLLLSNNGTTICKGVYGAGDDIVNSGNDPELIWYPKKGAFRVGRAFNGEWDNSSIGNYSFAAGLNSRAVSGSSIAIGNEAWAAGSGAVAIGSYTRAWDDGAVALGSHTEATGRNSFAVGVITRASGESSTAMGDNTTASGNYSTAMGNAVSTNAFEGAFILGDASTFSITNSLSENSFTSRFAGGYRLFTNSGTSVGVQVIAGGNAWSIISDMRRKENFQPLNGEDFLNKISKFNLVSWNYKGQDPKTFRHYGPMAQEFYAAFGKDSYGSIGNDTTINQADFDGVNLIAIQALEKRTTVQQNEINTLKKENEKLRIRLQKLEEIISNQR